MAATRSLESSLVLSIGDGGEHEFALRLGYHFTPGYPDTRDEPGASASVEIVAIRLLNSDGTKEYDVPAWMQALIESDEGLAASLVADAREDDAFAAEESAERRAEDDRNDRMMEGR